MENPIKMDDLGIPKFLETPIWRSGKIMTWDEWKMRLIFPKSNSQFAPEKTTPGISEIPIGNHHFYRLCYLKLLSIKIEQ